MSSKVQTMASALRLHDATKPRRFDLTMSRRTRRPSSLSANCHQQEEDHVAMEGSQTMMTQPQHQVQDSKMNAAPPSQCPCLSDHLQQSQHSEAAKEECHDNSRGFSLQELIQDDAVVQGVAVPAAAAAGVEKPPEQVAGRKVIGMMRRYVRVVRQDQARAGEERGAYMLN
ncbi:unnamed protein product [Urochloa humidicola]